MESINQIILNACNQEVAYLKLLWDSFTAKEECAEGNLYAFLDCYVKKNANPKIKDADCQSDVIELTFNKLHNVHLEFDKNPYSYIKSIYYTSFIDYIKSNTKISSTEIDTIIDNTELIVLPDSNSSNTAGIAEYENSVSDIHYSAYGNLTQLKFELYLTPGHSDDEIKNSLIKVNNYLQNPILYGYYNERVSSTFHNLKHNLWSNFNINHRPFMLRAIELMESSKSEERPNKPDPLVGGCVVDKNGNIVATASRGERGNINGDALEKGRLGEHCEFILFKQKLVNIDVSECTLYVTLEPCSKRGHTTDGVEKRPCAVHIISSGIKKVCIGMLDPDRNIFENGIYLLIEAGIEVSYFHPDLTNKIVSNPLVQKFVTHRLTSK